MSNNTNFAPIVIFAYNRLKHLQICIEALKQNEEAINSSLFIYCDGPKNNSDEIIIKEVRNYIKTITGFKKLEYFFHVKNMGLSKSIINGVTSQFSFHTKLIVLEDDIITSKYFLSYMNQALDIYEYDYNVASIHGYTYPISSLPETFFIRGADCWGWATWKRSWIDFEKDGNTLLKLLKENKLILKFNLYGAYNYVKMLINQIDQKNDSWAIRWHATNFVLNKLTLYPGLSLVENIGADGSGTNFKKVDKSFSTTKSNVKINFKKINVDESIYSRNLFIFFFYKRKFKILIKKIFYD